MKYLFIVLFLNSALYADEPHVQEQGIVFEEFVIYINGHKYIATVFDHCDDCPCFK